MDKSELHQHILSTLQRHGVSPCEDAVLGIVRYGINLPPLGIAEYAKLYDDKGVFPYGEHALTEYVQAVHTCIEKGWLAILTPDYFEQEARRRAASPLPELIDTCYRPGDVAFTEAGFSLYRVLTREMFGPESLEEEHAGCNWDGARRVVDIYATDEEGCRSLLEEIEHRVAELVGEPARVIGVDGPRLIGHWKPDRFTTVSSGFHAVLRVELLGRKGPLSGASS